MAALTGAEDLNLLIDYVLGLGPDPDYYIFSPPFECAEAIYNFNVLNLMDNGRSKAQFPAYEVICKENLTCISNPSYKERVPCLLTASKITEHPDVHLFPYVITSDFIDNYRNLSIWFYDNVTKPTVTFKLEDETNVIEDLIVPASGTLKCDGGVLTQTCGSGGCYITTKANFTNICGGSADYGSADYNPDGRYAAYYDLETLEVECCDANENWHATEEMCVPISDEDYVDCD